VSVSALTLFVLGVCLASNQARGQNPEHGLGFAGQPSAAAVPAPNSYRDPRGRFTLTLPNGWNATTDANGTPQLSSGSSWVTLVATGGSQPDQVNHQLVQQIQPQYKDFQVLNEGPLQVNGHPAHGSTVSAINRKPERVSILVISVSAGSGHFLTCISSTPVDQAKTVNGVIMQIVQSIRFAGE
jgi:hypothetical protein